MKKIIDVVGGFAPLNREEINQIKKLHRANPGAIIRLSFKQKVNDVFVTILKSFTKEYAYLRYFEYCDNYDYQIDSDVEFCFDNFYLYYRNDLLLNEHDLLEQLLRKMMGQKRFEHSLRVADTACKLAKKYHCDIQNAYLAGLLHDIVKEKSNEFYDAYLSKYELDKVDCLFVSKHAFVAKYYLMERLNLYNRDVLNAIYHHCLGESNALLAKIIYIADKREPGRNIPDDFLDQAFVDIHKTFKALKCNVKEYIERSKGIH